MNIIYIGEFECILSWTKSNKRWFVENFSVDGN